MDKGDCNDAINFVRFLLEQGLSLAWVIATVATLGSLYFSEIWDICPVIYAGISVYLCIHLLSSLE